MITYQKIGSYGRLGNQMFQYAAMLGISERTGHKFGFAPGRLLDCFDITEGTPLYSPVHAKYLYSEPEFSFRSEVFDCPDSVDFEGYFQSEKYWIHARSKVLEQFHFLETQDDIYGEFTSLHIRRGDYVSLKETHTCLADTDYYDRAIQALNPKKIVIFSDDKDWLTRSGNLDKWGQDREIVVSLEPNDVKELQAMSKAKNAIIANSSFSWWGAYLGPYQTSGRVISPRAWFGPRGPQDWLDIYCQGWEVL